MRSKQSNQVPDSINSLIITTFHLHIILLPAIVNYQSRKLATVNAIAVQAFGIRLNSEARFRIMTVDHGCHFRCRGWDCILYSGVEEGLVLVEELGLFSSRYHEERGS